MNDTRSAGAMHFDRLTARYVRSGIRLAIGKGIIGVVVAELFGARAGLGYQITVSSQAYDTAGLFAAVGILAVAGVGLSAMVQLLENASAPWRRR